MGLEPTTGWLQISYTTNCVKAAYTRRSAALLGILGIHSPQSATCGSPKSHSSHLFERVSLYWYRSNWQPTPLSELSGNSPVFTGIEVTDVLSIYTTGVYTRVFAGNPWEVYRLTLRCFITLATVRGRLSSRRQPKIRHVYVVGINR